MIHKLKTAGEELTLAVKSAEIEKGQYGEQVKFVDANGNILFVPLSSVVRQLDRVGVADIPELVGRSVHFSRAASNKPGAAPYWNMDKALPGEVASTNGKAADHYEPPHIETGGAPVDTASGYDSLVEKYGECIDSVAELLAFRKRVVNDQAFASMVACVFIERNKKGV